MPRAFTLRYPAPTPAPPFNASDWGTVRIEFDFSDTSKITSSSGAVSSVAKTSGSLSFSLDQSTAANKPTTGTRTKNGLNVLDFDGTTDQLVSSSAAMGWGCPYTMVAVCEKDVAGSSEQNFLDYDGAVLGSRNTGTEIYSAWHGQYITSSVTVNNNDWSILIATVQDSPATSTLYRNGSSVGTATNLGPSGGGALVGSNMYVGSEVGRSRFWDGCGAHIIVYAGVVANVSGLDAALNAKWAVY